MAKGSGNTRNIDKTHRRNAYHFSNDSLVAYSISKPDGGLMASDFATYLAKDGITRDDIDAALQLINGHTGDRTQQDASDTGIAYAIDNNTPVGKALLGIARIEEDYYRQWKSSYRERVSYTQALKDAGAYSVSEPQRELYVYRGGGNKRIESYTTNSGGANIGNGKTISTNQSHSVTEMLKTHYVLGGLAHHIGIYAGENEVLFIRKRK